MLRVINEEARYSWTPEGYPDVTLQVRALRMDTRARLRAQATQIVRVVKRILTPGQAAAEEVVSEEARESWEAYVTLICQEAVTGWEGSVSEPYSREAVAGLPEDILGSVFLMASGRRPLPEGSAGSGPPTTPPTGS